MTHLKSSLLGDYKISIASFAGMETIIKRFSKKTFLSLSFSKRFSEVNQSLYQCILSSEEKNFLLPAITHYIQRINDEKILKEPYTLALFEFWLNHFSSLSWEENRDLRGRIVGKRIPREDYHTLFPIGMGKVFYGTHFVAAHLSPDVDTTIASFWGWMDAFAARVGTGLHRWALPGGPPDSPFVKIFRNIFGKHAFVITGQTDTTLLLTAMDLLTRDSMRIVSGNTLMNAIEHKNATEALLFFDEQDHLLGEWRSRDLERVRPIIIAFKSLLQWLESSLLSGFISLFSQCEVTKTEFKTLVDRIFHLPFDEICHLQKLPTKQIEDLSSFFQKTFGISKGIHSHFLHLGESLQKMGIQELHFLFIHVQNILHSNLFDKKGKLQKDRAETFYCLEELVEVMNRATFVLRSHIERFDIHLSIKKEVLEIPLSQLSLQSDVEEMRLKMEDLDYLSVTTSEKKHSPIVGVLCDPMT